MQNNSNNSYLEKNERTTVLLVEDDPVWQGLLRQSIKAQNPSADVHTVSSVKKAKRMIDTFADINFVIADFWLEGEETGLDLWKDCESLNRPIPFLLISGAKEANIAAEIGEGPNYLSKALGFEELRASLSIALNDSQEMYQRAFARNTRQAEAISGMIVAAMLTSLTCYVVNLHQEVNTNLPSPPPAVREPLLSRINPYAPPSQQVMLKNINLQMQHTLAKADRVIAMSNQTLETRIKELKKK